MTELRVELTTEERDGSNTIAIAFSIRKNGEVLICEEWEREDESWGDGCCVSVPPRIWALGAAWVAEKLAGEVSWIKWPPAELP
jgi:hypothetical protein